MQNNAKRALPHQLVKQYFKHLFCASLRCWADASDGEDEQIFRSFAANFQISLSPMSLELAKHSNTCRNMLDLYGLVILVIFGFQFWESSYLWFLNGLQGQREVRRPRRQKRYLSDPVCIDIIWLRRFVDLEDATKCRGHDLQCNSDLYSLNSKFTLSSCHSTSSNASIIFTSCSQKQGVFQNKAAPLGAGLWDTLGLSNSFKFFHMLSNSFMSFENVWNTCGAESCEASTLGVSSSKRGRQESGSLGNSRHEGTGSVGPPGVCCAFWKWESVQWENNFYKILQTHFRSQEKNSKPWFPCPPLHQLPSSEGSFVELFSATLLDTSAFDIVDTLQIFFPLVECCHFSPHWSSPGSTSWAFQSALSEIVDTNWHMRCMICCALYPTSLQA